MNAAKTARSAAHRSFTRNANEIDNLLMTEELDLGDLRDSLCRLEQVLEEIRGYDLTVRQHILETVPIDEAALDTEQSGIDVYEKRFIKTQRKVRDITNDGESRKSFESDNRSVVNVEMRNKKTK